MITCNIDIKLRKHTNDLFLGSYLVTIIYFTVLNVKTYTYFIFA